MALVEPNWTTRMDESADKWRKWLNAVKRTRQQMVEEWRVYYIFFRTGGDGRPCVPPREGGRGDPVS